MFPDPYQHLQVRDAMVLISFSQFFTYLGLDQFLTVIIFPDPYKFLPSLHISWKFSASSSILVFGLIGYVSHGFISSSQITMISGPYQRLTGCHVS